MAPSPRERFLSLFRGEPQSSVPCVYDLTYWRDAHRTAGTLPDRYRGHEGFLALHRDLGVMPYYVYAVEPDADASDVPGHAIGGEAFTGVWRARYRDVESVTTAEGLVTRTILRIAGRDLTRELTLLPRSYCHSVSRHPVQSAGDLATLRLLYEHLEYETAYETYRAMESRWGADGYPVAILPRSPVAALLVDWMGLEGFTFALADQPEEVRATLDCIDRANDAAFAIVCRSGPEVFHFADNISAAMVSSFFDPLSAPGYRRRLAQLHAAGKRAAVHIDGTMRGILGRFAACGMDAAESLTPKPVGDVGLEELRAEAGNASIILWGGIPASMLTPRYTADDIEGHMRLLVSWLGRNRPFIAGSADQVPPDADLAHVRRTTEALAHLGCL
jgi:hypothetical protein